FPQPVIAALRLVAEEDVVEQPSHGLAMPTPFRLEGFDARKAEAAGQRHPFRRIFRYFMRLRVVPLLQAVLQPAEEVIRLRQRLAVTSRQAARPDGGGQRGPETARPQRRFAAAADQLEQLQHELSL